MIKWSVEHKSIVILFTIAIFISGAFLYIDMERQENPTISSPIAVVKCIYPGASPEDIEKEIIKPIEDELGGISEIKTTESFAMDSIGVVKVSLRDLSDDDISDTWDRLKEKIDTVKTDLPSSAYEPTVDTDFVSSYGVVLGLTSKNYTYEDFNNVAKKLKDQLKKDPGVEEVDIVGEVDKEIQVNLDMLKLQQYGISPQTIGTVLKARNVNIPGGNLEIQGVKVPAQITGEYKNVEEIKNTIVSVSKENGTPVYLKDVAQVEKVDKKQEKMTFVNNQPGLLIGIKYMEGENVLSIQDRLDKIIKNFVKNDLYTDMELIDLTNQANFVEDSIGLFEENLYSAIALVALVVILAMGIRSAFVVSFPIPVVIAIVFIYMYISEIPLHQVSIASLIISLSLLVANGIVANDNINVYLERGMDRFTACTKGIYEVKIPILTSTLTTVASFLPLAMMQGSAGKFVKSLPILVSVALMGSYLTSLTLVPVMGHRLLKVEEEDVEGKKLKTKIVRALKLDGFSKGVLNYYGKSLGSFLKRPLVLISVFIGIFILSFTIVPSLGVQLFPPVERDQYVIDITIQDGSTTEKTEKVTKMIGDILENDKSVNDFACTVGDGFMKYYLTFIPNNQASNKAQFLVNGDRSKSSKIEKQIKEKVPGVVVKIKELEISIPATYPVQVRIAGDDISELRRIGEEVKSKLQQVPGGKNMEDDYGYDSYKLNVNVNQEKANLVGISTYDIASTVRMAVNGFEVSKLKQEDIEKDSIPIVLKVPDNQKKDRNILNNIFLTSQVTKENVPISQIATVETKSSLNKILRRNGKRTLTVGLFVEQGYNTLDVLKKCEETLKDYKLPDGYTIEYGGENETSDEAFSSMKIPTVIAIILIYLILVIQFGDLVEPLIIMGTIPLSFIGIIWGLKWMGYPIGFMAVLGAISLMGVVVNNGIVLLDYIKLLVKEYDDIREAIVEACKTRLRPIMIGMITTVISLIPLAVSGGLLWGPMATAIIFGMLVSSALTLYVIPCTFLVIEGRKYRRMAANGSLDVDGNGEIQPKGIQDNKIVKSIKEKLENIKKSKTKSKEMETKDTKDTKVENEETKNK